MLDLEPIKERLAWVDEEGLNGYTWDIKDTYRQYRDLVAEVERLRDQLAFAAWHAILEGRLDFAVARAWDAIEKEHEHQAGADRWLSRFETAGSPGEADGGTADE